MENDMRKYLNKVQLINESIFKSMKDEVIEVLDQIGLTLNNEKEQQAGSLYITTPKNGIEFHIQKLKPRGFMVKTYKNEKNLSTEHTYNLKPHLEKMLNFDPNEPKKPRRF